MSSSRQLFDIDSKVALITGGGQGIGRMIARAYVEWGARVYIASRKVDSCVATARELTEYGSCIPLQADISTETGCDKLAAEVMSAETAVHILVNNAGATWGAPFDSFPESAWNRSFDVNVRGAFQLTRAILPALVSAASPSDPARVINIGSVEGLHVPSSENYAYGSSKAALHHLTRVLARKLGPQGVTVNAIAPGPFETKMTRATLAKDREALEARSPLGRIGEPDDMAGIAIYLASRAGAYVTGAVIPVDGGLSTTL